MKDRISILNLSVSATLMLLLSAGMLIILGIFNNTLGWDIFSDQVEKLLYALFGSCVALAAIGVAITFVLGGSEAVRTIRLLVPQISGNPAINPSDSSRAIKKLGIIICSIIIGTVLMFALINNLVQRRRHNVYRKVAQEQFESFKPRLIPILTTMAFPPRDNVPAKLHEYIKALDDMSIFSTVTLYIPDQTDAEAMWGYTAWRGYYYQQDGFARFYPVKPFEKAMTAAVSGNPGPLQTISDNSEFEWYGVIKGEKGSVLGILRLDGNSSEDFRAY